MSYQPQSGHENSEQLSGYDNALSDEIVQQIYDKSTFAMWHQRQHRPCVELPKLSLVEVHRLDPGSLKRPVSSFAHLLKVRQANMLEQC